MSEVQEVGNTLGGMFGRIPPEQLHQIKAWIEEYALPTLTEVGEGSSSPDLTEAVALLERTRELIDDVLALSETTRTHLINYLAGLGLNTDQSPLSLPHPSTGSRIVDKASMTSECVVRARDRLPVRGRREPTTGLFVDPDGNEIDRRSGGAGRSPWQGGAESWQRDQHEREETQQQREQRLESELADRAGALLITSDHYPELPRDIGRPDVSTHVETKAAQIMRERGNTNGVLVVNNEICREPYGCEFAVPAILPRGYTLYVWEPGTDQPHVFHGKAIP
ncbi:hypothetical protein FHR84_000377 [Actinopolyspora biskrensis]|uniref:SCP1.201-like deaminase n=1 Tax=Actinopolyspora biskrensis TaxID=1470178 RepID=A0A852Z477_9ACTN|nr:DddA-like double-stranded DNA deaminase toxin [Actinopolyspora biskrensis]NYH77063.1 hypothetical protein [Actinopolyspora biskrensis]